MTHHLHGQLLDRLTNDRNNPVSILQIGCTDKDTLISLLDYLTHDKSSLTFIDSSTDSIKLLELIKSIDKIKYISDSNVFNQLVRLNYRLIKSKQENKQENKGEEKEDEKEDEKRNYLPLQFDYIIIDNKNIELSYNLLSLYLLKAGGFLFNSNYEENKMYIDPVFISFQNYIKLVYKGQQIIIIKDKEMKEMKEMKEIKET